MLDRVLYLDYARAIAIIWIVALLHPLGFLFDQQLIPPVLKSVIESLTDSCLASFTAISGYFLGKRNFTTGADVKRFFVKRFTRFVPLFVIACMSLYIAGVVMNWQTRWFKDTSQLIGTLTGVSCFIKNGQVATFWYLSMLMVFYYLTPIVCRGKRFVRCAIAYIVLSGLIIWLTGDIRILFYFPFYFIGAFWNGDTTLIRSLNPYLLSLSYVVLSVFFNTKSIWYPQNFVAVSLGVLIMIRLSLSISQNRQIHFLEVVAYCSMGTYLFHRHVFALAKYVTGGDFWPIWLYPFVILASFGLGYVMQKGYDRGLDSINKYLIKRGGNNGK